MKKGAPGVTLYDIAREEARRRAAGEPPTALPRRMPSFAERTGQARRFWTATWVVIVGSGLTAFGAWKLTASSPKSLIILFAGILLSALGFAGQCLSVRCPRCRVAVVWHTYSHQSAAIADKLAAFQVACPACGFEPELPTT